MLCLCSCSSWGWACQGPKHVENSSVTYVLLLNCALKLVEEIILYYDARSKKHQMYLNVLPHRPQHYASTTLCKLPCFSREPFSINRWPQTEEWYCFSPVCIFMCKFYFFTHFPHTAKCWCFEGTVMLLFERP